MSRHRAPARSHARHVVTPSSATCGKAGGRTSVRRSTLICRCRRTTRSSSPAPASTTSRDVSLTLPRDALVVITGLSGSGKSSLAFDTIYAEGQRRYVESLSAYARQFLGQMDKPDVDSIEGLSPAISIDQKTTSRNPRSTVGTVTEIYDYLRLLWARIGHPHCHICGKPIAGQSAEQIIDQVMELEEGTRFMVLAPVVRGRKGEYGKLFEELRAEGFQRAKVDGELRMLEEEIVLDKKYKHDISVVVDRLVMRGDLRKRLADSIETAVALADGMVEIETVPSATARHRRRQAVLREVRLPRPRAGDPRARAADLLVQLAPRRLPALHRPGLADGDRPRAGGARPVAVDRRGRDRAVGGLDARTTTTRSPRRSPTSTASTSRRRGASSTTTSATCSCTAPTASASRSPTATATGAGARTRRASRASCPTSSGATARPTPSSRARRSRSTCRSCRARRARARGCGRSRAPCSSAGWRSTSSRR